MLNWLAASGTTAEEEFLVFLDGLGSEKSTENRIRLLNSLSKSDTFSFEFELDEIHPWEWVPGNEECRGGKTVIGKLIDNRRKRKTEQTSCHSGELVQLTTHPTWNDLVEDWEKGDVHACSGRLLGWDATNKRYQMLATEVPEGSIELLLAITWILKILLSPIWIPCWFAYKFVYVAIGIGLGLGIVGMLLDDLDLATQGWFVCAFSGGLGLILRFYVWAINLRAQESGI